MQRDYVPESETEGDKDNVREYPDFRVPIPNEKMREHKGSL